MKVIVKADGVKVNGKPVEQGSEIDIDPAAGGRGIEDGLFEAVPRAELKERLAEARESGDVREAATLESAVGVAPARASSGGGKKGR